ncbi:MAG: Tfp pilus assembly protein PilO [Candidatus Marinamargulisbacteria bacterium]|jgi:Tfp pilus assembly protein PilO
MSQDVGELLEQYGHLLSPKYAKAFTTPLIAAFCVLALFLASYQVVIVPKKTRLNAEKKALHTMKKRYKEFHKYQIKISTKDYKNKKRLLDHIYENPEDYVTNVNKLFIMNPMYKHLSFLNIKYTHDIRLAAADKRGIRANFFTKSELDLTLTGTYKEIGEYLFNISQYPFLFHFYNVSLDPNHGPNQKTQPIKMGLRIHFYFLN